MVPDDSDGLHLLGLALHSQGKLLSDVPDRIDESKGEFASPFGAFNGSAANLYGSEEVLFFQLVYGRSRAITRGTGCGREVPGGWVGRMPRSRGTAPTGEHSAYAYCFLEEPSSIHVCNVLVPVKRKLYPRDIELWSAHLRPLFFWVLLTNQRSACDRPQHSAPLRIPPPFFSLAASALSFSLCIHTYNSSFRRGGEAREIGHIFRRPKQKQHLAHEVQPGRSSSGKRGLGGGRDGAEGRHPRTRESRDP